MRTVLEGSVRRAGSRIRVTAQLINAEDGYHLWSERYDRELQTSSPCRTTSRQAIARALQVKLDFNPARHTLRFSVDQALLKARHHARAYVPEAHARAKEYCEQAIALDSKNARLTRFSASHISSRRRIPGSRCRKSRRWSAARRGWPWNRTHSKPTRTSFWERSPRQTTTTGRNRPGSSS